MIPHEKTEIFYSLLFDNGVFEGFYLDLDTARAKKELDGNVVGILKRTTHERIELVEGT